MKSKFHYLRAHLDGETKQVVISLLELSAANYRNAWDLLCERYNNKRVLIQNQIKSLLDILVSTQESSVNLRKMLDNVSKHIRALNSLSINTEEWDVLLIYLLGSKLDKKSEREWEEIKISGDLPTLEEFKTFIKRKADVVEKIELNHVGDVKLNKAKFSKSFTTTVKPCDICQGEHFITNCAEFLKLSSYQKSEKVKQLKLC